MHYITIIIIIFKSTIYYVGPFDVWGLEHHLLDIKNFVTLGLSTELPFWFAWKDRYKVKSFHFFMDYVM